MAPLIDEKYLLEQTDDNKDYIFKRIKEQIAKNKKKYPDWKKRPHLLREGLPKPFLYGNEIVQIKNVSAFGRGEKNIQLGRQTGAKKIREALLRAMTDKTGAATKTAYGRGARKLFTNQEDHHILFRTLLDNFYRDLDPDDAAELTAHLARRGSPVGNVIENLQGLDIDLHDSKMPGSLHQWARDMNIDSKSFPDLTNLDFDARTAALDDWLDLIEEPLLDRTATILSRQDFRRYGTKGLSKRTTPYLDRPDNPSKQSWLEYLTNQRENVKARANLLDKYPILAEDLDSPNIRPELKARYKKALSLVPEEELKTFKALTSEQETHALAWFNDPEYRKTIGKPTGEVTEVGRRLGGIGDTISTKANLFKDYTSNIIQKSGAVVKPFKPLAKKGVKYGLPAAGLVFANMNRSAISAEYEENPTNINLARKRISEAQVGLETFDTATFGIGGAVTWVPNLLGDATDYILKTIQTPQTKEESDKEIEDQLGDNFYTF
tara:strand:+ start:1 stop:1479 length:1479 start_codon:yes stop_codon:yes gene_type:complete